MAVVTTEEFANHLGGWTYTGVQEQEAQALLDGAQSDLERYLNRPLQRRRVLERLERKEIHDTRCYLKVTPIIAVHGAYAVDKFGNKGKSLANESGFSLDFVVGRNYVLCVTDCYLDYTGGLNGDIDPGVKSAIKRVAARAWPHKHDDTVTVQSTETRPPSAPNGSGTAEWAVTELQNFDRYRRRVVL